MSDFPEFKTIICKLSDKILTITLNRPYKMNSFTSDMFAELEEITQIVSEKKDIYVVIITGSGKAFSSGADLSSLTENRKTMDKNSNNTKENQEEFIALGMQYAQMVFDKIENISQPTIAAINGHAIGAGLQLSLACDFRLAVSDNKIKLGLKDVKIGIIPGLCGTIRLPKLIGISRAKELILTGDLISPEKAYDFGLLNKIIDQESFENEVNKLALKLAHCAPLAVAASKKLLNSKAKSAEIAHSQAKLLNSADAMEGMTAFLEKREPVFSGK
jgi:enoyl-CoA hydratase/carnithine racemase